MEFRSAGVILLLVQQKSVGLLESFVKRDVWLSHPLSLTRPCKPKLFIPKIGSNTDKAVIDG